MPIYVRTCDRLNSNNPMNFYYVYLLYLAFFYFVFVFVFHCLLSFVATLVWLRYERMFSPQLYIYRRRRTDLGVNSLCTKQGKPIHKYILLSLFSKTTYFLKKHPHRTWQAYRSLLKEYLLKNRDKKLFYYFAAQKKKVPLRGCGKFETLRGSKKKNKRNKGREQISLL